MATVILDTGVLDKNPLQVGQADGTNTLTPVERQVYPSATNERSLVSVQEGMMVVVTAYGDFSSHNVMDELVSVYKVLLAEPVETTLVSRCELTPRSVDVTIIGEAKLYDKSLTKTSPVMVITIPGMYSLRVADQDLTVTAMPHAIRHNM